MKNKIYKYIKVFISVALILSLVAPSYASLSASDGSAFVTKAEFDSALADFNSRLTTFEAGINSKIDSQVTSYLDRNGIWSGKDQFDDIVNKSRYWWGFAEQQELDTVANWMKKFTPEYQREQLKYGWINDTIVQRDTQGWTKSGLLCVDHVWMGFGPEAHVFVAGWNGKSDVATAGGNGEFGTYWNGCLTLSLEITSGDSKIYRRIGYGDVGDYANIKSNLHFEDFNTMDIMFVNRGDIPTWTTKISGSGTYGLPVTTKFEMNKLSYARSQGVTTDPVVEDWDMESAVDNLPAALDQNTWGAVYSCGWYKVKGLKIY